MSGSRVFEASFNSPCALDCTGIREGDQVHYADHKASTPQHLPGECRHGKDTLRIVHGVCSACSMERLPDGSCPSGCDD